MPNESTLTVDAAAEDDLLELLLGDTGLGDGIIDLPVDATARPGRMIPALPSATPLLSVAMHC
ncbi:hypothetical protein ACQP1S_20250 [Micromonospora matsumotoense]|uniref:hypothetical protein n=1 Tax=Micromonospora matsumotoense TaxID=121616 RepID=UPI003D947DC1